MPGRPIRPGQVCRLQLEAEGKGTGGGGNEEEEGMGGEETREEATGGWKGGSDNLELPPDDALAAAWGREELVPGFMLADTED